MTFYLILTACAVVTTATGGFAWSRVRARMEKSRLRSVADNYAFREIVRRERKRLPGW
jgi:hypothetical protein